MRLWLILLFACSAMAQTYKGTIDWTQLKPTAWPYVKWPHMIDTGAGTEASAWTHNDNTAGIQTSLTALSTRGGGVSLASGRFNLTSAVTITQTGSSVAGWAAGFSPNNAEAEGTTGTKLARATDGNLFQVGSSSSSVRPGGVVLKDLYLWGNSRTPGSSPFTSNAAIVFSGYTDQVTVSGVRISNFGVGIHYATSGHWTDAAQISRVALHGNGYGIFLATGGTSWYSTIQDSQISDNDYHGIYAQTSSDVVDNNILRGNTLVRNCRVSGCSSNPANVYWDRNESLIEGNQIQDAGVCLDGSPNCPGGGATRNADELYLAGNGNTVKGNYLGRKTLYSGASCLKIAGNLNIVIGNTFEHCDTDITVLSGALDTKIYQPGAVVSDSGTRTVINGVGTNAGDPDTTGNWNGVAKWPGLIINDTSNTVRYLYYTASSRISLGAASSYNQTLEKNGTPVTQRAKLNLKEGSNISLTFTDNGTDESSVEIIGTGGGSTVTVIPPYITVGGTTYVAATGHAASLPSASPTWINSVAPTVTAGTNGDVILSGTGSYWQIGGATVSVEAEFQFYPIGTASGKFPGAGVYVYDSTNSRIWWFHPFITSSADLAGVDLALETWTYTGSGNPSFSGSTNKHFPYSGGPTPFHLKLSVASTTLTASASANGGANFVTVDTETVGTIGGVGYSVHGDTSTTGVMDVYSLIVH